MTRLRRGVSSPFAVLICGVAEIVSPEGHARQIAPFNVDVVVRWGVGAGSEAFRDDLARSLADNLAKSCFAGVAIGDPDPAVSRADLVLTVVLSDVVDETRFDDSIVVALKPDEPGQELRRVAHFEVTVSATLSVRSIGTDVQRKQLLANVSRRPTYVGEDPQATARADAIEHIVGDLTKALHCGSAKLERKIRGVLGTTPPPRSEPR